MDKEARIVLFQVTQEPPMLKPVAVIGEPTNGWFLTTEPVDTPDGPVTQIPAQMCYEYDEFLMRQVNRMVHEAIDLLEMANTLIRSRATSAVQLDDIGTGKMH